jgi:hypothetical protein
MDNVFNMTLASGGTFAFLWGLGILLTIILLGIIGIFSFFGYQATHMSYTINDKGLDIGPGIYSRFIPKEIIDVSGAKVLNLDLDKDYQLKWRTNGGGLPGFSLGWFTLQNGEKALAFVTDKSSVIYIPTTDNYSVLLSTKQADLMMEQLQNWD